jgi:hypothetical protein
MATQTTHYNLTKPDLTDLVDVTVLNDNADIIDQAIYEASQSGGEEMTLAQYNALTPAQQMDGTVRYITDVSVLPNAQGVSF